MEFSKILEKVAGHEIPVEYHDWRPGDQKVYISNISKAHNQLGWSPEIGVHEGLSRLYKWASENIRPIRVVL